MKIKINIIRFVLLSISLSTLYSCTKDQILIGTDKELYDMSIETTGFTWFQNSSNLLEKSSGSGHPQPYLKTRYNEIAASQLDSSGRILSDANFPDGSLIVKELYDNTSDIGRYAILYKKADHEDADANGWVWGYVDNDENIAAPASTKGASCISCHSQSESIDYMLMNKFYP